MLKKAMIYLGLGPDEHYESYDDPIRQAHAQTVQPGRPPAGNAMGTPYSAISVPGGQAPSNPVLGRTVRPVTLTGNDGLAPGSDPDSSGSSGVVRPIEMKTMKPHAVSPNAFNDAQEIGDRFKSGQPVIVNLQAIDRDLRRRLVDFSSGLCYAMGGKMDRVADQVYLLIPADVQVSRETSRQTSN